MSGIFGLLMPTADRRAGDIVRRMTELMAVFPWETGRTVEVISGRLFLGATVRDPQESTISRFVHREADLTCVVDGFFAGAPALGEIGKLIDSQSHAAAACAAYRSCGADFPARLTGQFSVLLCDETRRRLIAGNSRNGYAPLHLRREGGCHIFASSLGPLVACGLFEPELDAAEISLFLTYGQYFGRHTLVRGVEVLDAATIMDIPLDGGEPGQRRYWHFGHIEEQPQGGRFDRQIAGACEAFVSATSRIVRRGSRLVSGLSGGFDSRLVTALASRAAPNLQAWTFGGPQSTDVTTAREVSHALGIGHLVYPVLPESIPAYASDFAATTNGAMTVNLAFGLARCQDLRARADLVLNGNAGDAILGGSMLGPRRAGVRAWARYRLGRGPRAAHPLLEHNRDDLDIALYIQAKYGHASQLATLLAPRAPSLKDLVIDDLARDYTSVPARWRIEQWVFWNRVCRWTIMGILSDRPFYADDSPFYNYDVFERCLAIPPRWRRGHRAYVRVLKQLVPEVAGIVSGNTGLPATAPSWRVAAAAMVRRISGGTRLSSTGTDANAWARQELREFYGDLIHSASTLGRPFWDGRALQQMYAAHQRRDIDCAHELGLVAAIELFLRRWIDRGASKDAQGV